ncbi:LysR family transcriptional regulator [Pseudorhodoplanes sp.]|uniref:LysR family transcriptional regulator n=1 Tax=Pseudorhodoplanes sp. TaxID=1934341 RepID=UPI003D09D613
MNIRQLETLYWAVKLGSFSSAADKLHSTQSTVSMRILELESEFGVNLFSRDQRTARVTAMGAQFAHDAEEILALISSLRERYSATDALTGLVRLGVVEAISMSWLPAFLSLLKTQSPLINVEIEEGLTRDIIAGLEHGSLDIAFIAGRTVERDATVVPLGSIEMNWVASQKLDIPNRTLSARELSKYPIITLAKESYHYETVENWFRADGVRRRKTFTCKSASVCIQLAGAGLGVTLIPIEQYRDAFDRNQLRCIKTTPVLPAVEFNAVYRDANLQPAVSAMCQLARHASTFIKLMPEG